MSHRAGPARDTQTNVRSTVGTCITAAVATVLLTGCVQVSDAAEPIPVPETQAQAPTPTPAPGRPFQTIASSCETIVTLGTLEAAAGVGLTPGGTRNDDPLGNARMSTAVQNAGGFACTWSDSATGVVRVSLTVVPEAVAADERIRAEFAAREGGTATASLPSLSAGCIYDYCTVKGFNGSTDVNLHVYDMPWSDSGSGELPHMEAIRDEVAGHLDALPAAKPLPGLSTAWGPGPTSCDEMLPPGELATDLAIGAIRYDVGYAYEESNGWDVALLAAGGFTCRYHGDGAFGGRITVLPDAGSALGAIPSSEDLISIDVPGASAAGLVRCWSNGEPFEAGTGLCTVDVSIRGAWVSVLTASSSTAAEPLQVEAAHVVTAIATALG